QFNIKPLSQTRAVSANELQVKVEERTQKKTLKALQNDLQKCKEDLEEGLMPSSNIYWGPSDSQVGEPHFADDGDLQESISEELYNKFLGGVDEIQALGQSLRKKSRDVKKKIVEAPVIPTREAAQPSRSPASQLECPSPVSTKQTLTEEESYHLEVKIVEILKNKKNATPEMMLVQIHEIAPVENISNDYLAAVVTSVLESIIYQKCFDPGVALTILESYTDADIFITVLINTLKSLKNKLVKPPKNNQKCNCENFASLLAMVFIQSQCWSLSICKAIQAFSLSTVEKWIIFNKRRQQEQETAVLTELVYLDCVYYFMRQTASILNDQFPDHVQFWMDEIREKLLHDLTERCLRVRLLDILLDNVKDGRGCSYIPRPSSASVGTQTGSSRDSTLEKSQRISQGPFYKAPRGSLYARHDPYTPHDFNADVKEDLRTNDTFSAITQNKRNDTELPTSCFDEMCEVQITAGPTGHPKNEYLMYRETDSAPDVPLQSDHHEFPEIPKDLKKSMLCLEASEGLETEEAECKSENTVCADPSERRIVYSLEELKAMNPLNGKSRSSIFIKEPFELKHIFSRMDENLSCSEKENTSVFAERGGSKKQRSRLSPDGLGDIVSRNSNYSPSSDLLKMLSNPDQTCQSNSQPLVQQEDRTHGDSVAADREIPEQHSVESSGLDEAVKTQWPNDFFKDAKKNCDPKASESEECKINNPGSGSGKKKKKTKFRPLQDFMGETTTYGVDESGKEFDDLEEFSDEALQMYITLEKEEKERGLAEARIIHGPVTSSSSRKNVSLFADVRRAKPGPVYKPWVPGKRKCTRCGSENHIITDCTESTINNIDDMSYMF
ncbi:hypothetical protein EGW08_000370, partial [Elysia chlorotica]